jgi:hypothetical protein
MLIFYNCIPNWSKNVPFTQSTHRYACMQSRCQTTGNSNNRRFVWFLRKNRSILSLIHPAGNWSVVSYCVNRHRNFCDCDPRKNNSDHPSSPVTMRLFVGNRCDKRKKSYKIKIAVKNQSSGLVISLEALESQRRSIPSHKDSTITNNTVDKIPILKCALLVKI